MAFEAVVYLARRLSSIIRLAHYVLSISLLETWAARVVNMPKLPKWNNIMQDNN